MATLQQVKYESNVGDVHLMRMTMAYAAQAGTEPAGAVTSDIIPKITKSNREYGIRPRGVRLVRTIGTAPDTFKKYTFLAVLTATAWDSAAFAKGAAITIDSIAWTVVAREDEDF